MKRKWQAFAQEKSTLSSSRPEFSANVSLPSNERRLSVEIATTLPSILQDLCERNTLYAEHNETTSRALYLIITFRKDL